MRFLSPDLEPKFLTTFREGYSARDFSRDALAGIVVGVVALPLAIAFAIASGVIAEFGYQGLAVATLMAGCFLVIMALARLGDVIRFIPYPVSRRDSRPASRTPKHHSAEPA